MSVADRMGFGPKREAFYHKGLDVYVIRVTAPAFVNPSLQWHEVHLTSKQYHKGYLAWRAGAMIQDVLPELSERSREILMSGLTKI